MSSIHSAAVAAREHARHADGKFGTQQHSAPTEPTILEFGEQDTYHTLTGMYRDISTGRRIETVEDATQWLQRAANGVAAVPVDRATMSKEDRELVDQICELAGTNPDNDRRYRYRAEHLRDWVERRTQRGVAAKPLLPAKSGYAKAARELLPEFMRVRNEARQREHDAKQWRKAHPGGRIPADMLNLRERLETPYGALRVSWSSVWGCGRGGVDVFVDGGSFHGEHSSDLGVVIEDSVTESGDGQREVERLLALMLRRRVAKNAQRSDRTSN